MDMVIAVGLALLFAGPWAALMLQQPTATPSGYLDSAPSRDLQTGSTREVGTSGAPLTGVPTSYDLSLSPPNLWRTP